MNDTTVFLMFQAKPQFWKKVTDAGVFDMNLYGGDECLREAGINQVHVFKPLYHVKSLTFCP